MAERISIYEYMKISSMQDDDIEVDCVAGNTGPQSNSLQHSNDAGLETPGKILQAELQRLAYLFC